MKGYLGRVIQILEETRDRQILEIELDISSRIIQGIHYIYRQHKKAAEEEYCSVGDYVMVNTSALDLELGTGGYAFVINQLKPHLLNQEALPYTRSSKFSYPGHIIKLRYTPMQTPVLAAEAQESEHHSVFKTPFSLQGKRVIVGELHSMLPILVSLFVHGDQQRKIAYIMDDQAALYLSFSTHIQMLQHKANLTTITYGQALGGDIETVNLFTALEAAYKLIEADDIIITQGPGVVGTGTPRGFSGMQLPNWIHTIHTCGGEALVVPRIQLMEQRDRHYGVSHHTLYPLISHTLARCTIPYPVSGKEVDEILFAQLQPLETKHQLIGVPVSEFISELEAALEWYRIPILTMGRSYREDPYFYYAVGAVAQYYRRIN